MDTIEEFASENATVVVGTVIDPEMSDELKVTVVATGLGTHEMGAMKVVSAAKEGSQRKKDGTLDFDQLELPTVLRQQCEPVSKPKPAEPVDIEQEPTAMPLAKTGTDDDMDFLDIPAFLRRQAD